MDQVLLDKLAKLNISRERRRKWQRFVSVVAVVVVFCTTYALILPAITMHTQLLCGVEEHLHSATCGPVYGCSDQFQGKTVIHSHNAFCYDTMGKQICFLTELEAHTHTEGCLQLQKLICGKDEVEPHSHGENCYVLCEEPQCGIEPQEPHQHTDDCFAQELNCQLDQEPVHQHAETCYELVEVLICGLTQQEGHMHSEQCSQQESRLNCQISTEPHIHDGQCYTIQTVCGLPETAGHSHSEDCHWMKICQLPEQDGHTHDEGCWEMISCQQQEVCAHVHNDDCQDENGVTVCQKPEVLIHNHEESCIIWQCGMEEHTHVESCYPQQETQFTEPGFLCGFGEHTHAESCYDETELLICSIPEHKHTAPCILEDYDAQADTEVEEQWMSSFAGCQLGTDWRNNVAEIAGSQMGYAESKRNVLLQEDGSLKGYTRYGAWSGNGYADWNSLFAAFCIHYAGVESFPMDTSVSSWMQQLKNWNYFRQSQDYHPVPGDVMFLDRDINGAADWVAIVMQTNSDGLIHTAQGDVQDGVTSVSYGPEDAQILGYGLIPPASNRSMVASQEDYTVEVLFDADAMIPADAQLIVEEILPGSAEYDTYYTQSLAAVSRKDEEKTDTEIRFARFFDIRFVANGLTMEPSAPVDVRISYANAVEISKEDQGLAIHFADDGVEVLDAEMPRTEEQEQIITDSFAFTQNSFSVTGTVIVNSRAGIDLSNASQLVDSLSQIHVTNSSGMETKIFANGDTFHIVMEGSLYSWQFTNGQSKTLYFKLSDTMRLERYICSNGISSAMIDGSSNTFLMEVPAVSNGNTIHFRVELQGTAINQTGGISYVTIRWDQYQIYSSKQSFVAVDDNGNTVTADIMGGTHSPSQYDLVLETLDASSPIESIRNWIQNNYHRRELEDVVLYRVYLAPKSNPNQQIPLPAPYTLVIQYENSPFEVQSQGTVALINMNNGSPNTPGSSSVIYDNGLSRVCLADQHNSLNQFAVAYLNGISAGTTGSGYTLEYNNMTDAFLRDPAYRIYYNSNSPIGTAGSFHIVAFDTANLNTHTNGNILARNLNAFSNFGTNNYGHELTYIQNYNTVNSNSASSENHILVLGSENVIGFYDNNNKYTVNGQGIDRPKTILQDADTGSAPFINLNRVRAEIQQISARLVGYQNQGISVTQYSQKHVLKLTDPDGVGVLNVKATDPTVFGTDYIQLDGFQTGHDGSIVINVDCAGVSQINMPKALVVVDGQEQPTSEVTEFSNGKVLWNFVNARGVTINTHLMTGMVIAPGATVNINQNLNGTVVADVVNVNAESHRTDFTGKIVPKTNTDTYSATIQKVRTGYMGTTLAGAVFDLYIWNGSDWQKVNEAPLVTNASGLFMLERLQLDTAYQLVETKAPEGYVQMEAPYQFWVRSSKNVSQPGRKPQDFEGVAISSGAVLNIANDLDAKVETTSLEIQKIWDTPDPPHLNQIAVTLYQMSWKNQQLVEKKEYRSVVLSGVLDWKITLSELPLSKADAEGTVVTYTYAVEEVPLDGYTPTYSIDNDVGVSEGSIIITNRVESPDTVYALPETGGPGTGLFTLIGFILVCFAAAHLLYPRLLIRKHTDIPDEKETMEIHCIVSKKQKRRIHMKITKKVFACILVVMLIMAMTVPAAAEGEAPTYTITVQGTAADHTYEAYQIFSGTLDSAGVLTGVTWGTGVDTSREAALLAELKTLNRYKDATDAASVAKALDKATSADGLEFAAIVGKYLSTVKISSTAAGSTYTLSGLDTGYYLIKDMDNSLQNKPDESYTEFIMSISKNTTVNPKSGHPSIFKKVSETGVSGTYDEWVTQSIGSKVHFDIRGTISGEIHYYDTYYYAFHDTMSQGLTFDEGSVSVTRVDANGGTNVIDPACYRVTVTEGENNTTKVTVTFDNLLGVTSNGQKLTINRSDAISLHYTATLNPQTQIGLEHPDTNKVKLEYSNNPNTDSRGFTHEVDVDVYTFGLEILKVDAMDSNKKLPGAQFILYRTISDVTTYAKANQLENGVYKISEWVSGESNATSFVTGADGTLKVSGVKAGGFYVKEIVPPSGYNPLEEPLEVWIQVNDNANDVAASVGNALVEVDASTGYIKATIENASGTVLPSTGGIGTTIFYVAGGILFVAALILLVTKKRMDAEA